MAFATINKPNLYFNTLLYTGTGTTNSVTGVNFKPDFVWIKQRSAIRSHVLYDLVRGATKDLRSNDTTAEATDAATLSSFNADGFTVVTDDKVNVSSGTYASWNWLGSNTTTNNTAGTISSTVCANTTSGFSIVSYTGNGNDYPTGATVGHGLGVAPSMIITKSRTESSTNWCVYHKSLAGADYVALLNSTAAPSSGGDSYNRTNPTSTVFSVGQASGGSRTNGSGASYISYCFAEVKGYSAFGSYAGTGSTNGPFIYTGFKPAFVMVKISSGNTNNWVIMDNKINTYNTVTTYLLPDTSGAQGTDMTLDFLSNGFKPRATFNSVNGSGYTYIYMAFAENPFVGTNNVPTTAR